MTIVNILGFLDRMVSAAAIQLCHCSIKKVSQLKGMAMFSKKLYLQKWVAVRFGSWSILSSPAPDSEKAVAD